jgi:hypothetical protein
MPAATFELKFSGGRVNIIAPLPHCRNGNHMETLLSKIHVRVILEVALIAMARKVIIVEPASVPGVTLFGIAALILALGVAFYFERQAHGEHPSAGRSA